MDNRIPERQNEEGAIRLLGAQRHLYRLAKRVLLSQIVFVALVPGVLIVIEYVHPAFKSWAAFLGLTIATLDIGVLEPLKISFQRRAAATQELFDCRVLELDWPTLKCSKPDREETYAAPADPEGLLKDWYPSAVGKVPISVARIICQRSNCWWDSNLRRFYWITLLALSAITSLGIVAAALLRNMSFENFVLSLLAPVIPFILWAIREARQQIAAAQRANRLKSFGDELWDEVLGKAMTPESASVRSRMFQDEIYENRSRSPLMFSAYYWLFRNRFESRMRLAAEERVVEASKCLR